MIRKYIFYFFWKVKFSLESTRSRVLSWVVSASARSQEATPFFIVGCGRSGNTVLRRIICENYNAAIPPENPFIYKMIRRMYFSVASQRANNGLRYLEEKLSEPRARNLSDGTYYEIDKYKEFATDFSSIINDLVKEKESNIADIFSRLYESNAKDQVRLSWGDKTPVMIFNYELIKGMFPQAKFVFMVRDPIDCVSSYCKRMNVKPEKTAARWYVSSKSEERIRYKYPSSIITVRYEDLVSNHEYEIARVANFLNLTDLPENATQYRYGDDVLEHHEKSKKPLDSSAIGLGEKCLSVDEINLVSNVLRKRASLYGYKL